MPPGFLAVFSEPGANVTIDEYQDWYSNEHIPIRLDHLPSFLTGARYSASDSLRPSWVAVYDVDDTSTFFLESYTKLRTNRSPREADLVKRLELLDRRTYEVIGDENKGLTSSYHPVDPTKFILTQGIECPDDAALKGWFNAIAKDLNNVEGWTRTGLYKCIDNLKSGMSVGSGEEEQKVPKYLVIYEFLHPAAIDSSSFKSTIQRHSAKFDVNFVDGEERKWGLYRAYPGIAQS
ncbi:hypothetical protein PILCRDRAFT_821356 [Piloderma croceum F 1598]|uniref:EthD domain-containing protein n=1 Tax=Piloderma croceum (strain F 1598) TaxID=765440 RepID=A0A0C3B5R1_PILCF|nr:hypothetical protein PILCRDRAFT_821356 [Piloderma croceum F 1598]